MPTGFYRAAKIVHQAQDPVWDSVAPFVSEIEGDVLKEQEAAPLLNFNFIELG